MSRALWNLQARLAPYLFLLPFAAVFAAFLLYPIGRSLVLSLHRTAGPRHEVFVGLGNYRFLLTDKLFWLACANTIAFTLLSLILQAPASLGLALLLNSPRIRLRSAFRFAFFSTHIVGGVFLAVIFANLLSPRAGLLNQFLGWLARRPVEINWLGEPNLVLPVLLLASLWVSVGFGMIYFLAALQSVDRELYEAAIVDGASRWQRFWHVTLPGIRPVLIFLMLVNTIAGLQLFELPYVLYQGSAGPGSRAMTIVMYLVYNGFEAGDLGYASTIGWVLLALVLGLALAQVRLMRFTREAS